MRIVFMALRHFVISSMARFFSEGRSSLEMLSRTERTRSWGVFGLLERLKRNAIVLAAAQACQATDSDGRVHEGTGKTKCENNSNEEFGGGE
jgi:hypothetical protein